jgi:hypothetical protein
VFKLAMSVGVDLECKGKLPPLPNAMPGARAINGLSAEVVIESMSIGRLLHQRRTCQLLPPSQVPLCLLDGPLWVVTIEDPLHRLWTGEWSPSKMRQSPNVPRPVGPRVCLGRDWSMVLNVGAESHPVWSPQQVDAT